MRSWRDRAVVNLGNWGEQSWPELVLATVEEIGELAQAVLEHEYEDGDAKRIPGELCDVGALGYQMYWKATEYPPTVDPTSAGASATAADTNMPADVRAALDEMSEADS